MNFVPFYFILGTSCCCYPILIGMDERIAKKDSQPPRGRDSGKRIETMRNGSYSEMKKKASPSRGRRHFASETKSNEKMSYSSLKKMSYKHVEKASFRRVSPCITAHGTATSHSDYEDTAPTNNNNQASQTFLKSNGYFLYITFHADDHFDVKIDTLVHRVLGGVTSFTILESGKLSRTWAPSCVLELPDQQTTDSARDMISTSRQHVTCSQSHLLLPLDIFLMKSDEVSTVMLDIESKIQFYLKKHETKIDELTQKIKDLNSHLKKPGLLEQFSHLQERDVTDAKREEMRQQAEEYRHSSDSILHQLEQINVCQSIDKKVTDLKLSFGIECARLACPLPMYAHRSRIMQAINENQVTILLGETGSGKSTQLVQYLHETGHFSKGIIACTQPRKIAARSLAEHVSKELVSKEGCLVGYKVRAHTRKNAETRIMFMTDHTLLNDCLKDPTLSGYTCLVIDEAHERSIYSDLLLGMIKKCLHCRPELKIVITSATIDPEIFVNYFDGCPVVKVPGRMYPVDVIYDDTLADDLGFFNELKVVEKTIQIHQTEEDGDILVFLSTPVETERCCRLFEAEMGKLDDFLCLPLHGKLQTDEQNLVFHPTPPNKRKIVFATNCAETSITITGIKYVIDTGLAKQLSFDGKRNISSLAISKINKSSAEQRKGRAGRLAPGICYRMYSRAEFDTMDGYSQPEILRVHLGQALLKLMELGVDPLTFDFVEAPPKALLQSSMNALCELGAVQDGKVTDRGHFFAKLPVAPHLGLMIHCGVESNVAMETIAIAALSTTGNSLFYRGGTDQERAQSDKLKVKFADPLGDQITLLNVYREWVQQTEQNKNSWCVKNSINAKAMRGARELMNDTANSLRRELSITFDQSMRNDIGIVLPILSRIIFRCYSRNLCHFLGHRDAGYIVTTSDGWRAHLHPSSVLKLLGDHPQWVVFQDALETTKQYVLGITPVDEELLLQGINEGFVRIDVDAIKQRQVELVYTIELGSELFRSLVGPRYANLKTIETEIAQPVSAIGSDDVNQNEHNRICIVEALRDRGEVLIYSDDPCQKDAIATLDKHLLNHRRKLLNEDITQALGSQDEGQRAVISCGGGLIFILMANEFRSMLITRSPPKAEVSDVEAYFSQFGNIQSCHQFKDNRNKTKKWGRITFKDPRDAERASFLPDEESPFCGVPDIGMKKDTSYSPISVKATLTWCRRPSRRFGFISFGSADDLSYVYHNVHGLMVDGSNIVFRLNKQNGESIYIRDLSQKTVENDVKKALVAKLGDDFPGKESLKVSIIRENMNVNSETETTEIRNNIQGLVGRCNPHNGTHDVTISKIRPKDFTYRAIVTFYTLREGYEACAMLENYRHELTNLTVEYRIEASVFVHKQIYQTLQAILKGDIDDVLERFSIDTPITVDLVELKSGNYSYRIRGNNADVVETVLCAINVIIDGEFVDIKKYQNGKMLFTQSGRVFASSVGTCTNTFIHLDNRTHTVRCFGKSDSKQEAICLIKEHLEGLEKFSMKRISLNERERPSGLMKTLILRYGFTLEELQTETGLSSINLHHKNHELMISGDSKAIDSFMVILNSMSASINDTGHKVHDASIDCMVCLCTIELDDMYRLAYCGHPVCSICVKHQLTTAVQNKEFPLSCAGANCDKEWVCKDVLYTANRCGLSMKAVVSASVVSYVNKHPEEYRFCPSPDCPLVYKITTKPTEYLCGECLARTCTACHKASHEPMTCEMHAMSLKDTGIQKWMNEDNANRRQCPNCSVNIQKDGGCLHVTCTKCRIHICWKCMKTFPEGSECYGHLTNVHGTMV